MKTCINCRRTEQQIPLLELQFQDREVHICPQCLPILIHHPRKLDAVLPGMEVREADDRED